MTIFFASVLMMLSTQLLSPLLPTLVDVYDVPESSVGLIMTALTLPPIVFIPVMGVLTNRFSRRYVLTTSLVVAGITGVAIPLAPTFDHLLALRVLQGIGYSGVMPTTVTLLGDLYDGSIETTAQGIRALGNNVGAAVFPIVGGALVVVSWRAPFVLYALCFPAAILAYRTVPSVKSKNERPPTTEYLRQVIVVTRRETVLALFLTGFTAFFLQYAFLTYAPMVLTRRLAVSPAVVGLYIGLAAATSAVGASQAGRLGDVFSHERTIPVALVVAGGSIALFSIVRSPFVLAVVVGVFGCFRGILGPTQRSALNQTVDTSVRAGINSASYTTMNVAKAAAPIVVGLVAAASSYEVGFITLGAIGVVSAAAVVSLHGKET